MARLLLKLVRKRWFWLVLLLTVWLFCSGQARAGTIAERLTQFPNWTGKPTVQVAQGDLAYPEWMAGTWVLRTTLVDLVAPLAPEVKTPGFESSHALLNQPIDCVVRFVSVPVSSSRTGPLPTTAQTQLVSDRAFNGLNLARAYLGQDAVKTVKVDPANPNRQITVLSQHRQLESTVSARAVEATSEDHFLTTEVFQQVFRGDGQLYFNQVETTTAYQHQPKGNANPPGSNTPEITADQVTAIYLSPQDPDYFLAGDHPVALYRYHLAFVPLP